MKKNYEGKKVKTVEEHKPWELEVQTEGLDELQGERLDPKNRKPKQKHIKS